MRQELFIDGQRVDLSAGTSITLEWVSGLFEDIGSISMSRSYTIQLPKTSRNLRILDDPGNPAHASNKTRCYLDALYLRNGVDLLGTVKAYVISVTSDSIEVGLLWRVVDGLLEWRDSGKKLSDLPLSTITWVGSDGEPDYTSEYFARYVSGLSQSYPTINAAPHPSVSFFGLFYSIFREAGIAWDPYRDEEQNEIPSLNTMRLLCDGHRPSLAMEIDSGLSADNASVYDGITLNRTTEGWDSFVKQSASSETYYVGDNPNLRIIVNFKNALSGSYSVLDEPIRLVGVLTTEGIANATTKAEFYFKTDADGVEYCSADETVDFSGFTTFRLDFNGAPATTMLRLPAYDATQPAFSIMHVHDAIQIANDNRFPLAENLPDMTQVDFIKGACALLGIAAICTSSGVLKFVEYDRLLDTSNAVDWTDRVAGELERVHLSDSGRARNNYIRYMEDVEVRPSPDAAIVTEDTTLAYSTDLYKLPFAASNSPVAKHYKVTSEFDEDTLETVYEVEDVEIKPRVFARAQNESGEYYLHFPSYLKGDGLVAKYYSRYQEAIRKQVVIEATMKLNELDLVSLDFTRPVYLAQTGQYYAVKTVQADDSDLCKVKLIQIT